MWDNRVELGALKRASNAKIRQVYLYLLASFKEKIPAAQHVHCTATRQLHSNRINFWPCPQKQRQKGKCLDKLSNTDYYKQLYRIVYEILYQKLKAFSIQKKMYDV